MKDGSVDGKELKIKPGYAPFYFGIVPPLLLLCALLVFYRLFSYDPMTVLVFEPPLLQPILSTVFLFLVSCVVSYVAMEGYLLGGSLTLLLLGSGVLTLGTGALLGGWMSMAFGFGPNPGVTIFNVSILISSVFHLTGMAEGLRRKLPEESPTVRRRRIMSFYLGILAFLILVAIGSASGIIPPFFQKGSGPTALRQAILVIALVLFSFSALSMLKIFIEKRVYFFYWYALALSLLAFSIVCIFLQRAVGSPIGWIGRGAQYLSGIYFVVAVISESRNARGQGLFFNQAIADLFMESEIYWQDILDTVREAIISCDEHGRILKWNQAAVGIFGYPGADVMGKSVDLLLAGEDAGGFLGIPDASMVERMLKRKDASLFPADISISKRKISSLEITTLIIRDTTKRKLAEATLQTTMQRLFVILSNMNSAILLVTNEGLIEFVNQSFCDRFGLSDAPADLIGLDSRAMIGRIRNAYLHPDEAVARIREIVDQGQPVKGEELHMKNGETYLRDFVPLMIQGKPYGRLWVHFEITGQKRHEVKINRHNLILQGISRMFEDAIRCETEEDLGRTCLEVIESITGSKMGFIGEIGPDGNLHDLAISNPGWELCSVYDKAVHRRPPGAFMIHGLYGRVLRDGKSLMTNNPSLHPDSIGVPEGHPALTAFLGVPLIHGGKTIGMIAVANRDGGYGTENLDDLEILAETVVETLLRKRAEEEVRVSYDRMRTLFDHRLGGIGVVIANARGAVLEANDFYLKMLDFTRDELVSGKVKWTDITPREWFPADEKCLAQLEATGICDVFEKEYIRRDGSRVPVLITGVMMPESDDILAFVLDNTERKRDEHQILQYIEDLKDSNEELTRINNAMVDRELRMIELKREVNVRCIQAGMQPPYDLSFEGEQP
jgi:PAS domain S-box-containing protein